MGGLSRQYKGLSGKEPTASDIGAVQKAGDTMTGNLILKTVEASLSGTYTITEGLGQVFGLNPNGADRDVLLPPNPNVGLQIQISNTGSLGNILIVKNSAGVAVSQGTIANNVSLTFTYFSSGWRI
jgi:hypothetical protein